MGLHRPIPGRANCNLGTSSLQSEGVGTQLGSRRGHTITAGRPSIPAPRCSKDYTVGTSTPTQSHPHRIMASVVPMLALSSRGTHYSV